MRGESGGVICGQKKFCGGGRAKRVEQEKASAAGIRGERVQEGVL